MGCPLYPVQTSLFPPTAGGVFLKTGFFNFYLHLTNAVKRRISFNALSFHLITILSNSSAFKWFVITEHLVKPVLSEIEVLSVNSAKQFCACLSLRSLGKQSRLFWIASHPSASLRLNRRGSQRTCPELRRRSDEESQLDCEGAYAMPRPEQIEKYAPQFVISSIRERSRISHGAGSELMRSIQNDRRKEYLL